MKEAVDANSEAARAGDAIALARALISIPSVNPSLEEGGPGEADVAVAAAEWLEAWGFEVSLIEIEPGWPNGLVEDFVVINDGVVVPLAEGVRDRIAYFSGDIGEPTRRYLDNEKSVLLLASHRDGKRVVMDLPIDLEGWRVQNDRFADVLHYVEPCLPLHRHR